MRDETSSVVGGGRPTDFARAAELAHVKPLDLSTTYRTPDPAIAERSLTDLSGGAAETANPVYARLFNPNVRDFERRMAHLEHGADAIAFASGMAAITALLMEAGQRGKHVVAIPPLYGGTHHLLSSGLLGLRVTWTSAEGVRAAIEPDTSLVLLETPANPTLTITDIARVAREAGDIPVAVDSTFATPMLQKPLAHGATFSVHSATKFIGGHGDAMGGVITTDRTELADGLRRIRIATGALLHPLAAHTFVRGLQTLALRMTAQEANARTLAARFASHAEVIEVMYPGLNGLQCDVMARQMSGSGSVLSIRLKGGPQRADAFLRHLGLATPAVSLGSVDTLVQRPAALTHQIVGTEGRHLGGIEPDLIRISVGAEHVEDLWADFRAAIDRSGSTAGPRPAAVQLHATPSRSPLGESHGAQNHSRCLQWSSEPLVHDRGARRSRPHSQAGSSAEAERR